MRNKFAQINLAYINNDIDQNIRKDYGDLESLKSSIREIGVQIPIRVVEVSDPATNGGKKYLLDDGFRRVAACTALISSGVVNAESGASIEFVDANVIPEDAETRADQLKKQLMVNTIRKNLNALEEASTIQELLDLGETVESIQKSFGLKKMAIDQRLKLLQAPEDIKDAVRTSRLEFSAARELQRVTDDAERAELLQKTIEDKLSTRQVAGMITEAADKAESEGRKIKSRRKRTKADGPAKRVKSYDEIIEYLAEQQENFSEATNNLVAAQLKGAIMALQWTVSTANQATKK